jgi:Tfp pilus assembly protein PilO
MTKQPMNPNQMLSIIAAFLIVIGVGGTFQFLNPRLQLAATNLSEAKAKDDGLVSDIATLQNAQTQVDTAKKALTQKGLDFNTLQHIYPQFEEIPSLYIQMEYIVAATPGVSASYQISPPLSVGSADVRVPIAVSATGAYSDLKLFIASLENNVRPFIISTVSFGPAPTKDQAGKPVLGAESKLTANISGFVRSEGISSAYSSAKK